MIGRRISRCYGRTSIIHFSGYGFSFYEDVLTEQQKWKNGQRKEKYGERII